MGSDEDITIRYLSLLKQGAINKMQGATDPDVRIKYWNEYTSYENAILQIKRNNKRDGFPKKDT
jgi:hypothetical protein